MVANSPAKLRGQLTHYHYDYWYALSSITSLQLSTGPLLHLPPALANPLRIAECRKRVRVAGTARGHQLLRRDCDDLPEGMVEPTSRGAIVLKVCSEWREGGKLSGRVRFGQMMTNSLSFY